MREINSIDAWVEVAGWLGLTGVSHSPSGEVTIFNREARERGFLWVKPTELLGAQDDGYPARDMTPEKALVLLWKLSRPVDTDDEDNECPGHESLHGDHMGESVQCDGTCIK